MLAFIAILGIIISSCGKEYSVDPDIRKADSTNISEGNSWSFVMSYNGKDTTVYGTFNQTVKDSSYFSITNGKVLTGLSGESDGNPDHVFSLALFFALPNKITSFPFVLDNNSDASSFIGAGVIDPNDDAYIGGAFARDFVGTTFTFSGSDQIVKVVGTSVTIKIEQYDASNRMAIGSFEGSLQDGNGKLYAIKQGIFKVKLP